MAFCSYFKIQPVAGGADRIKKSEWKLVSHDNSQPLRERQLLLLLSLDSAPLPPPPRLFFSVSSIHESRGSLRIVSYSLPLLYILFLALRNSTNLSLAQRLPSVSSPPVPSLSPSSIVLNTTAIYTEVGRISTSVLHYAKYKYIQKCINIYAHMTLWISYVATKQGYSFP